MSEFIDYLHEVFAPFGRIHSRRMFGGYGIYRDGIMFALVSGEVLYLKADRETADLFDSRGLSRFQYSKKGEVVQLSYYEAPEEIFESEDDAFLWAGRAFEAALRGQAQAKRRKRKSTPARGRTPGMEETG